MSSNSRPILITGAAGFIGFHLAKRLLHAGRSIVGLDNLNAYYDPALKRARLAELETMSGFRLEIADLSDYERVQALFAETAPTHVVHLAAQAGVRYSIENPRSYISSNVDGYLSILEACRRHPVAHLIYASSSSVYGANDKVPFLETDPVERPVSLYAATKRANELMAQTYAHLYAIPASGLRFFTVYGPWGRPDMAYYHFTKRIFEDGEIEVYNEGRMRRDFTYVDDVIEAMVRLLDSPPALAEGPPHAVFNIGNHQPVELNVFIDTIAEAVGKPARKVYRPMQAGDVVQTYANVDKLADLVGFAPSTPLSVGIKHFVAWYRAYLQI